MTVKECVLNILKNEPHLSNQDVANKVRWAMNSKTTARSVSWYKSKIPSKNRVSPKSISTITNVRGIEKFKGCYIFGPKNGVTAILGAEARNIVQTLYKGKKQKMKCEYKGCHSKDKELHACHIEKERKEILEDAIDRNRSEKGYDVYRIFERYKEQHHGKNIVRFLCKKHHKLLDENKTVRDKNKFIKINLRNL